MKIYYRGIRDSFGSHVAKMDGSRLAGDLDWSNCSPAAERLASVLIEDYTGNVLGMSGKDSREIASYLKFWMAKHLIAELPEQWVMDCRTIDEFRDMFFREASGRPTDWRLWRSSLSERGMVAALQRVGAQEG